MVEISILHPTTYKPCDEDKTITISLDNNKATFQRIISNIADTYATHLSQNKNATVYVNICNAPCVIEITGTLEHGYYDIETYKINHVLANILYSIFSNIAKTNTDEKGEKAKQLVKSQNEQGYSWIPTDSDGEDAWTMLYCDNSTSDIINKPDAELTIITGNVAVPFPLKDIITETGEYETFKDLLNKFEEYEIPYSAGSVYLNANESIKKYTEMNKSAFPYECDLICRKWTAENYDLIMAIGLRTKYQNKSKQTEDKINRIKSVLNNANTIIQS